MLAAVDQPTKSTMAVMHQVALLRAENASLRKANEALAKRRRAKKTRIRAGGALSVGDALELLEQKEAVRQQSGGRSAEGGVAQAGPSALRHCRRCGKTGHNVRTCQIAEETSDEDESD